MKGAPDSTEGGGKFRDVKNTTQAYSELQGIVISHFSR